MFLEEKNDTSGDLRFFTLTIMMAVVFSDDVPTFQKSLLLSIFTLGGGCTFRDYNIFSSPVLDNRGIFQVSFQFSLMFQWNLGKYYYDSEF